MSMRISDGATLRRTSRPGAALTIAIAFALAACGSGGTSGGQGDGSADASGKLSCKPAGAAEFAAVCDLERMSGSEGLVLTIRHPDGMFRRLLVTRDGRGVIAADGAEKAVVTPVGTHEIEVALAGDLYRLPATVRGNAPAAP